MTWESITVGQYQELYRLSLSTNLDEFETLERTICILYNLSQNQVESLPITKFKDYANSSLFLFKSDSIPGTIKKRIGKYKISFDVPAMTYGQYVSVQHFAEKPIDNMHYILACIVSPLKFGFKLKNKTEHHLKYAEDLRNSRMIDVYHTCVYFLQNLQKFNKSYPGLFGMSGNEDDLEGNDIIETFNQRYGWIYSTKELADFKGITLDEAFDTPLREAFNYLAYLKAKSTHDREQIKCQR